MIWINVFFSLSENLEVIRLVTSLLSPSKNMQFCNEQIRTQPLFSPPCASATYGSARMCRRKNQVTVVLLDMAVVVHMIRLTNAQTFSEYVAKHIIPYIKSHITPMIVRRAGLLLSQQDFEWRWSVPLFQCLTVLEFSFILFDLCLLITFFNFIMNYVPIVTFWIFTYHKIWILSIMFCFIWSYWIIYFLACL